MAHLRHGLQGSASKGEWNLFCSPCVYCHLDCFGNACAQNLFKTPGLASSDLEVGILNMLSPAAFKESLLSKGFAHWALMISQTIRRVD